MPSANIIREGYPGILADGTPAVPPAPFVTPVVNVEDGAIFVSVDTTANPITLNLPSASRYIGQTLVIRATIPGANALTVFAASGEGVDGPISLSANGSLILIGARFASLSGVFFGWGSVEGA